MFFSYKAKKKTGEEISGEKEAASRFDLARILRKEGGILLSYKEVKARASGFDSFAGRVFGRVSAVEKIMFSRNLAVMIEAGLPMAKSLEALSRQTKNKKFREIIRKVIENLQKGEPFSESLKKYPRVFPLLFSSMVKAGEESGKLADSLKVISMQLKRDHELLRKIRGAMIYPFIICLTMVVIGIIMLVYVVPTLVATFEDLEIELPLATKITIGTSQFLLDNGFFALIVFAGFAFLAAWRFRTPSGRRFLNAFLLRLPLISPLVKKTNSARTARTLGSLVESGVEMVEALDITKNVVQNYYYREVLEGAKNDIKKGLNISSSFVNASGLYPPLVGEMISVGEETGKLSEMLLRLAKFYEKEVAASTKDLSTVIEPFLMVAIGAVVGFFAVSIISPIYSSLGNL